MLHLLASILPLDIAATISPGLLAITVILLSQKHFSKERLTAFFGGSLLVGIVIALVGFSFGQEVLSKGKHSEAFYSVDAVIGALFIFFGVKALLMREKEVHMEESQPQNKKIMRWFTIGIVGNATNFDAVFLVMTASKEIGIADGVMWFEKVFLLMVNVFFFTLPITLPVAITILNPRSSRRALNQLNAFLMAYGRYVVGALFIVMGVVFLLRALPH